MSRTQDLALARMRMLVARWQQHGGVRPPPGSEAAGHDPDRGADEEGGLVDADPGGGHGDAGFRGPPPVALRLLAVLVVVVVGVAGWMLVRSWPRPDPMIPAQNVPVAGAGSAEETGSADDPDEGAVTVTGPTPMGEAPFALGSAPAPSPAPSLVVHVAGEVRRPGLVVLPAGARVGDAVEAAGGLRRGGSLGAANLARVLADGERIEIGAQLVAQDAPGGPSAPGSGASSGPVDLNSATAEQLDALPGVGPVTAAKILAWRTEHGRFTVVDELAEVAGIGPKTLEELRPHVRV